MAGQLLLLHGLTNTPAEFLHFAEHFSALGYRVRVPCLLGHGSRVEDLHSIHEEQWLAQVESELRQLDETEGPRFVVGSSLGGVLALYLATQHKSLTGVVALAPTYRFRLIKNRILLPLLSRLPEFLIERLGTTKKTDRAPGSLALVNHCYKSHSLGAVVRLERLRARVARSLPIISVPVLLAQDPLDHHLSEDSIEVMQDRLVNARVRVVEYPGGQHELTLGHSHQLLRSEIESFIGERAQQF